MLKGILERLSIAHALMVLERKTEELHELRDEVYKLREETKHVMGSQLSTRIVDHIVRNRCHIHFKDMNDKDVRAFEGMLYDYSESMRSHLERSVDLPSATRDTSCTNSCKRLSELSTRRFKYRRDHH